MNLTQLIDSLATHLPPAMRWAGSVARRMRSFNIALEGKHSGSSNTDALTLADLWMDERANMLRLPGIIATSPDRAVLATLCDLARDWNRVRYAK
jgi:hypothetical protein